MSDQAQSRGKETDALAQREDPAAESVVVSALDDRSAAPFALEWTVHPLVERPRQAVALVAILTLVLLLVWLNIPEPGWVVFAAAILFISLARFFFPTAYRLDDAGIHVRFLGFARDHSWGRFRRLEPGRNGLFLSPFPKPNRLDNFRGLFLLWGGNRKEIEAFARERIASTDIDSGG